MDCVRIYLNCARRWSLCGAKLFSAKTQLKQVDSSSVWLAVSEDCITLLDFTTMQPIVRYPYGVVVTFGGCKEDFMLVVCQTTVDQKTSGEGIQVTERLLFSMPKPKILEITLLVADYMNAIGRSGTSLGSFARLDKIRSSSKLRTSAATTVDTFSRAPHESSVPYDPHKAMSTSTELDNRRGAFCKKRAGSDCT
ncbi:pleckstrin homology domain-containing family H member 1-like [Parasteatoda tepidariorum]|uniref:pleckstrin homology domain-containing family H member 1-like n=1 Tax=Parasteatoda tepidariorum TaxID=114398 RepID=UPI0039BD465D